jgi:hypothetical protein
MSTPLYDLQKVKEAVGFTAVHIPTSAEIDKLKNDKFAAYPGSEKGGKTQLPLAVADPNFIGEFYAYPQTRTKQIRDEVIKKGSLFYSAANQGIKATNANKSMVSAITFDLILSENHDLTATVCSHPVQNGEPITDHIQPQPTKVKLQVLVTEYSIKDGPGGWRGNSFDLSVSRGRTTLDAFRSIFENRMSCTLVTVLTTYDNMVLTRVGAPRDGASGEAQVFEVEAQQIRTVQLKTAALGAVAKPADMATAKNRQAAPAVTNGTQTPDDVDIVDSSGIAP